MIRKCGIEDISDGRRYLGDDLARVNCHDCQGCEKCCHGVGNTIVLDPYDIYMLTALRNVSFEVLMANEIELNMVDGLILPNMKMTDSGCLFLENGRCSIHEYRPGICRLFPLGRIYENDSFAYFIQKDECPNPQKSKIRIRDWIGIDNFKEYELFIQNWHDLLKASRARANDCSDAERKNICMSILNTFYVYPYEKGDFYSQYNKRCKMIEK